MAPPHRIFPNPKPKRGCLVKPAAFFYDSILDYSTPTPVFVVARRRDALPGIVTHRKQAKFGASEIGFASPNVVLSQVFIFSFSQTLAGLDLQREKAKDYRNLVLLLVVIIVSCLLISEPLLANPESEVSRLIISLLSFFGAVYAFLLWDLLRNFTSSKWLLATVLFVLFGIVSTGILTEFPYYQVIHIENRQAYLFTIHVLLFSIEVTVIGFALRDIFSSGFLTSDKLWGAACVFLLVGICFGSLYDLICIARPGSLGVALGLGVPNYTESVTFSFCVLGGVDADLNPTRLIRNLSVIEGVWGSIYAMLIIGKLLGLPRQKEY